MYQMQWILFFHHEAYEPPMNELHWMSADNIHSVQFAKGWEFNLFTGLQNYTEHKNYVSRPNENFSLEATKPQL